MKRASRVILMAFAYYLTAHAQYVYVDSKRGDDKNAGGKNSPVYSMQRAAEIVRSRDNDIYVIRINPGIYVLDKHLSVSTDKPTTDKRIVIEASILPDDATWTPESMPVIVSRSLKGELPEGEHFVASFLINESHVTIRGLKFHGYSYPQTRYFPVARFNKAKTDLLVEQCLFVGDPNVSQIQAGVIAHGNEVRIDHCIFYGVRNTVVFFQDAGEGVKTGNGITNSIIANANNGVWTAYPDRDFTFENNIVSNCRYVWVKSVFNKAKYSIVNCVLANNRYFNGVPSKTHLEPGEFEIDEKNVTKADEVALRLENTEDKPTLDSVDKPLPMDYMHVVPGSPGYEIGAGLFKNRNK